MLNTQTKFVKTIEQNLAKNTNYHLVDMYDNLLNNVAYITRTNINDECGFSIEFNNDLTKIIDVNLCFQDEVGDGPAIYTDKKQDIQDLTKALNIIQKYMD